MAEKHVYRFGNDENGNNVTEVAGASVNEAKWITGGKGANLAEMANIGLPVPPGFSITCQTCVAYATHNNTWPAGVLDEIDVARKDLERRMGKKLGASRPTACLGTFRCSFFDAWYDGYCFEPWS